MFLGIRTVIYPAPDLAAAKAWWTRILGIEPYFDEPFFVGFSPGGYELRLGTVTDAVGSIVGVIENPVFALAPVETSGPGK